MALSPSACSSWEAADSFFHTIPSLNQVPPILHDCFAIYALTNPTTNTTQAQLNPFDAFYDQLLSVILDVLPMDMLVVLGDFSACAGSDFQS